MNWGAARACPTGAGVPPHVGAVRLPLSFAGILVVCCKLWESLRAGVKRQLGIPGGSVVKTLSASAGGAGATLGQEEPWRREWQPAPAFLHAESCGQRRLEGYGALSHRVGEDLATKEQQITELTGVLKRRVSGHAEMPGAPAVRTKQQQMGSQAWRPQRKAASLAPWSWTATLQSCEKRNFCDLSQTAHGVLLWHLSQTKAEG